MEHFPSSKLTNYLDHTKMLLEMADLILTNNVFLWCHQLSGMTMDFRFATSSTNLLIGCYERWVHLVPKCKGIHPIYHFLGPYIDDVIIIWVGMEQQMEK